MSASGTTELIWHFAGYLRLPDFDYGTPTIIYQGQPTGLGPDETSDGPLHHLRILSESPYPDLRVGSVTLSESPYVPWHVRPVHDPSYLAYPHVHLPHSHDHHSPPNHGQDDSTAGGGEFTITTQFSYTATYQPGGDQELIDVRQINMMTNNNVVDNHDINAPLSVVLANDAHAASELATMLNAASDAPGQEFLPVGADTQQLISLVNNNDAHLAAVEAQFAPYQVQPGVYVNGELYTGSADPHQVTIDALNAVSTALNNGLAGPPAPPTGDGHDLSNQTVNVGSDITANDAVLANLEGATVSLAVAGNFYQTQEIVQTNVFQEFDHISGSSAPLATVSVAPNTVQNIADIQEQTPTLTSGGEGTTPTGLNWSVSVLNGSLYDVHSLVQTNYLTNNNVVYENTSTGISEVLAGGNTLANTAQFENLTSNYNLIIVEGNYNQDNLISQTNVLLDNNHIGLNAASGDGTTQSVSAGGNTVVNDASIVNIGNYSFQGMTPAAQSVLHGLENQQTDLTSILPAIESAFPNLVGNINVLVVTGNYYDINYISQTNVMSNANTVEMTGSQGALSSSSQTVQTGNDMAVNSATIYDASSALSPYLGGQYSNDLILIQTNIVADGTKIVGSDPNQLATELVAFTGNETIGTALSGTTTPSVDFQHHHASDPMASVLH